MKASVRYAALLRGINIGGHNKIPMVELQRVCLGLGFEEVATYIQSGNVLLTSVLDAVGVAAKLQAAIAGEFALTVPVVVRTAAELAGVVAENPFQGRGSEGEWLVGFLVETPETKRVEAVLAGPLATPAAGGDEFAIAGREVYMRCPNGYGQSKLTPAYFDRHLATTMTVRNWRTILKLGEMTAAG